MENEYVSKKENERSRADVPYCQCTIESAAIFTKLDKQRGKEESERAKPKMKMIDATRDGHTGRPGRGEWKTV